MTSPSLIATSLTATASLTHRGRSDTVTILNDVTLAATAGTVTALVGESGCGKSMIARTLIGLPPAGVTVSGTIHLGGHRLNPSRTTGWSAVRGHHIGYIPQSVSGAFTASHTIGRQLDQVCRTLTADRTPTELAAAAGLAADALTCWPHQLSGGMLQRAAIAAAIAGRPTVVVADEPTSALDPDLADHTWRLLGDLASDGAAVVVITHDMRSLHASDLVDDVLVMRNGTLIEQTTPAALANHPDQYIAAFGKAPAWN